MLLDEHENKLYKLLDLHDLLNEHENKYSNVGFACSFR